MKKANLILGSSVVILTGLLASCNPTTPVIPIAAPQNILTIPDDKNVTVIWDAVDDARVTGYNVYQDGKKVNVEPVAAASRVTVQAAGTLRRLQFLVSNVSLANLAKFTVRAIGGATEGTPSPESPARPVVCSRYLVKGTEMGMQSQNVSLTRASAALSGATVRVNGTNIPFTGSIFQGNLPSSVAVGANIEILTADVDCLVYSRDTLPAQPVMIAPNAGLNTSSSAILPVAWASVSNPDRFVVVATWLEGSSGLAWRSGDLAGTARTFDIPANSLPADKSVKIRVYAYNDGTETFIGAFETGSKMAIRNGDEAGRDISTTTTPPAVAANPGVSWGDPHLITFDQMAYEFQSVGEYDLGFSSDSRLRVQARQQPWGGSAYVSVNTAIATQMNGQKVGLYLNPPVGQSPLRVGNTGVRTAVPSSGLDLGAGYRVSLLGSTYRFSYPDGDYITVEMNGSYLNVRVFPVLTRSNTMKGLLGNFDGNLGNEFIKRDGTAFVPLTTLALISQYANSWKIPTLSDSLFVYDGTEAFGGFDNSSFPSATPPADPTAFALAQNACVAAGVQPKNIDACAIDKTQTGDEGFITSAASVQQPAEVIVVVPTPKPDLVIERASISLGSVCRPYNTFVNGNITIKNIGAGTSPAVPSIGIAQVVDLRDEALGSGYRGNGVSVPALAPNESITLNIPIFYPITTPNDTEGLRTYFARVDFGNHIAESNESNNRFTTNLEINVLKGHCKNRVGLIHGADSSAATAFKMGLENKGMRVTLLPLSSLNPNSTATLMDYDLLAIDPKTYVSSYTWEGATGIASAIGGANRPILGLGFGGNVFFEDLQGGASPIDWGSSWIITPIQQVREFTVVNAAHPTIVGPFALTIAGGKVQISDVDQEYSAANMPVIPSGVVGIGRDLSTLTTSPNHYSVAYNSNNQTAIWGFNGTPNYTDNGWKALANLGWFMLP